jgi:AraC family transcriptional regulator, exoenzyme S synthesis regulatory protein ExsA
LYSLYGKIINNPGTFRQLSCGESLITMFNCPLESRFADMWSHYNYLVYVVEGRKIWHTSHGSYDLRKGSCVVVRKGACIVEQFFDVRFCLVIFFLPDEFICDALKNKSTPLRQGGENFEPVIAVDNNPALQAFIQSMIAYFEAAREPDKALLQLKFTELVLMLADNPANGELLSYFCSLLKGPQNITLQSVMEENFCYNLKLEEFAKLSARSLSAFKRDFVRLYNTSPGKWLLEKRLNLALHLLTNAGRSVSETAFECGFESASHFSRAFRQRFGASPLALKQQNAN